MLGFNFAVSSDFGIDVMDVKAAFLEAKLKRDNVMALIDKQLAQVIFDRRKDLATGMLTNGDLVVKLKRALYGLRDAPRAWHNTLVVLVKLGFSRLQRDECFFFKWTVDGLHIALVHVDDIFSCGPASSREFLRYGLKSAFKEVVMAVDPEEFTYLGVAVKRIRHRKLILLCQSKYIEDVLESFPTHKYSERGSPCDENLY